jgi:hypothetical protein
LFREILFAAACMAAFHFAAPFFSAVRARRKVFNTTVGNSVEKLDGIFVSDSTTGGSAFCTGASAGTLVPQLPGNAAHSTIQ